MRRSETAIILLLMVVWVMAALSFASGPLFEGPDELEHYRYIHFISTTGMLPPPDAQERGQYHQAPLYYLINAPLLKLLGSPAPDSFTLRLNPAYAYQIGATGNDNKALYLHPSSLETSLQAQVVRLLRLVPMAFGIGTIFWTWRIAHLLFPASAALRVLMTAIASCTPQFAFLSGVINNDSLLIFLATVTFYCLLSYARTGLTMRGAALLGLLYGAILLTKTNGLFFGLLPLVMFSGIRSWQRCLPICALEVLLVVGWWYGRNLLLYQDVFLTQAWQRTWANDVLQPHPSTLTLILERLPYSYSTVWARFGSGAVSVSPLVDAIRDVLIAVGGLGLVAAGLRLRRPVRSHWLAVILFALCWLVTLLYLSGSAWSGNQGRYLLPGISAWAALLTAGIAALTPLRLRRVLAGVVIGVLAFSLGWSALLDFPAAYRPLPAGEPELPLNYRYENTAELLGASPEILHARPGDVIYETLHWRALGIPASSLKTFVHSVPPDAPVVQRDSFPGTGTLLAEDWQPGMEWSERFVMQVSPDAQPQQVIDLVAGLYDESSLAVLDAKLPDGRSVTPFVSKIVIHGESRDLPTAFSARFGNAIGLTDMMINAGESEVTLCLTWAALKDGQTDLRRFVHAFDAGGEFVAQRDGDPRDGAYPARYWLKGETVEDCVTLPFDGIASVAFGWYDPVTEIRLPAVDAAGTALANDQTVVSTP